MESDKIKREDKREKGICACGRVDAEKGTYDEEKGGFQEGHCS